MPQCLPQIRMSTRQPRPRIGKLRIVQVPDGKLRPCRGPMAHVKGCDRIGDAGGAPFPISSQELLRQRGVPQPFHLECEKRDLLRRVEPPQIVVELQAIDDARLITEVNVLCPQVPMTFDDEGSARREQSHSNPKTRSLARDGLPHQ